jgi:acyl dehydratase
MGNAATRPAVDEQRARDSTPTEGGFERGAVGGRHGRPGADADVVYDAPDWSVERSVDRWEDVGVGTVVRFSKPVTAADVRAFGLATGDTSRLHFDEAYAAGTRFDGCVVHGSLTAGVVSAALARLPGTVVYLSQTTEFLAPVRIGDELSGECEIVEQLEGGRYRLRTAVANQRDEPVLTGEAVVLVDRPPSTADGSESAGGSQNIDGNESTDGSQSTDGNESAGETARRPATRDGPSLARSP